MELIILALVVSAGAAVWYFNRDTDTLDLNADGKVDAQDAIIAVEKAVKGAKAEVAEAKAAVAAKLPTAAKLKALTKAQLDDLGKEFGVVLDARKNKDTMIADLKTGVKVNKK
jgi:hypothetical protein